MDNAEAIATIVPRAAIGSAPVDSRKPIPNYTGSITGFTDKRLEMLLLLCSPNVL
jgi:hypothetical protein